MAASAAFSSGSPTSSPSSSAREWHNASTHCTSNDTSFTGVSRCFEEEGGEEEEEEGGEGRGGEGRRRRREGRRRRRRRRRRRGHCEGARVCV